MTVRAGCPDCERIHALPPHAAVHDGLVLFVCGHCGHLWSAEVPAGDPLSRCSSHPAVAALPAMLLLTASGEGLPGAIDPRSIVTTVRSMGRDHGPLRIYAVITAFHLGGRAILQTRGRIDWQL